MRIAVSEFYFKEFHGFLEMEDKFHCLGLKFEENKISILSARNNSSSPKYDINYLVKTLTSIQAQPNLPVGFDMKMILPHPPPPHHKKTSQLI